MYCCSCKVLTGLQFILSNQTIQQNRLNVSFKILSNSLNEAMKWNLNICGFYCILRLIVHQFKNVLPSLIDKTNCRISKELKVGERH